MTSVLRTGRRQFTVTILSDHGNYPNMQFRDRDCLFASSDSIVYTVAPTEEPNEFGFSEVAWTGVENLRLWGAIAFALREGLGFFSFYPLYGEGVPHLYATEIDEAAVRRLVERYRAQMPTQNHELRRVGPQFNGEVSRVLEIGRASCRERV